MRITIANRLKPYSHRPGTRCIVPGTRYAVEVFPSLVRVYDLSKPDVLQVDEHVLNVVGPVQGFTVQQDLERGVIKVWGHGKNGYYRYAVFKNPDTETLVFQPEKGDANLALSSDKPIPLPQQNLLAERLSLGCHKEQDWCGMRHRCEMQEIFPFWLRLGQLTPPTSQQNSLLTLSQDPLGILSDFKNLFLTGFRGMFLPTLHDDEYHGTPLNYPKNASSLALLSSGAHHIRKLFVETQENIITPLPLLPVEFDSGRMINIQINELGTLNLEWRKRKIRRMVFHAIKEGSIRFNFSKKMTSIRLRQGKSDKGRVIEAASEVDIQPANDYFFDHFYT